MGVNMEMNPYASPAEQSTDQGRVPLLLLLAYAFCLFVFFSSTIYLWNWIQVEGYGPWQTRWRWYFSDMVLLPETVVLAIVGIAAFTVVARAKPTRLVYFGRAICIAQLIAPVLMSLLDRRLHGFGVIKCTLWLACANVVALHLALRRFEQRRDLAIWSLGAMLLGGAGMILEQFRPFTGYIRRERIYFARGFVLALLLICLLLVWRIIEVHWIRRSVEESHDREQSEASQGA